jgi:hypothetical protein
MKESGMAKDKKAAALPAAFSFNRLGPFYRLQRRLGLLSDTDIAAARRGLLFAALAWLPAVLLAALQGHAVNEHHERAILWDFSVYAMAIAIFAYVLMEQTSDLRLAWLVTQFTARGIVPEAARAAFAQVRLKMQRRTGSALAEVMILLCAYAISGGWLQRNAERIEGGTWFGQVLDGSLQLSWAGWWAVLVALPLYWFLLGRWLWRFATWGWMLRDIARCEMRLVATHADRCGGLAFIGQYPKSYVLFVFAFSTVISAAVLKLVVFGGASLTSFKFALAGMVVFLVLAFVLPLLAFAPVLKALKRQGLSHYGTLVSRHNLAFEAKWIDAAKHEDAKDVLGSPDVSSLADLAAGYELVNAMRTVPVTKDGVLPLLVAALVPLAIVAATQAPIKEILSVVKGLLLF